MPSPSLASRSSPTIIFTLVVADAPTGVSRCDTQIGEARVVRARHTARRVEAVCDPSPRRRVHRDIDAMGAEEEAASAPASESGDRASADGDRPGTSTGEEVGTTDGEASARSPRGGMFRGLLEDSFPELYVPPREPTPVPGEGEEWEEGEPGDDGDAAPREEAEADAPAEDAEGEGEGEDAEPEPEPEPDEYQLRIAEIENQARPRAELDLASARARRRVVSSRPRKSQTIERTIAAFLSTSIVVSDRPSFHHRNEPKRNRRRRRSKTWTSSSAISTTRARTRTRRRKPRSARRMRCTRETTAAPTSRGRR